MKADSLSGNIHLFVIPKNYK